MLPSNPDEFLQVVPKADEGDQQLELGESSGDAKMEPPDTKMERTELEPTALGVVPANQVFITMFSTIFFAMNKHRA